MQLVTIWSFQLYLLLKTKFSMAVLIFNSLIKVLRKSLLNILQSITKSYF